MSRQDQHNKGAAKALAPLNTQAKALASRATLKKRSKSTFEKNNILKTQEISKSSGAARWAERQRRGAQRAGALGWVSAKH